jgi:hypothetical protein
MRAKVLLLVVLTTIASLAFSQSKTIKGRVTSEEDTTGIPGVSVVIKGTLNGPDQTEMKKLSIYSKEPTIARRFQGIS